MFSRRSSSTSRSRRSSGPTEYRDELRPVTAISGMADSCSCGYCTAEEEKMDGGNDDLMDMADEDVMMLLPQFFAPKDMPDNLVLRLPGTSGLKKER